MRCDEFECRLNEILDNRRNPDEDRSLRTHAMVCADCSELLAGQRRFQELLRQPIPPLRATCSVEAIVPASYTRQSRQLWSKFLISVVAATLLIALLVPSIREARNWREARRAAAAQSANEGRPGPANGTTIAALHPGPRNANAPDLRPMERHDSEEMRNLIRQFWQTLPEVPEEQFEPIDRIAGGFRPLASTLGAALDALRRSLPVGRESPPTEPQAFSPGWDDRTLA